MPSDYKSLPDEANGDTLLSKLKKAVRFKSSVNVLTVPVDDHHDNEALSVSAMPDHDQDHDDEDRDDVRKRLHHADEEEEEDEVAVKKEKGKFGKFMEKITEVRLGGTPVIAWLSLALGLLTVCTVGPAFKKLGEYGVPVLMRPSWRSQVVIVCLLVPFLVEMKKTSPANRKKLTTKTNVLLFIGVSIMWTASLVFWLYGIRYTTLARASLLTTSYPIVIVVWYKITKVPISMKEIAGTCIALVGVALTMIDNLFGSAIGWNELKGDAICLTCAFFNAASVLWGSKLRQSMQLMTYTWTTTALMMIMTAILSIILEDTSLTAGGAMGVFGWVTDPDLLKLVLFLGVVVGTIGVNAYNFALKHTPPLAYAVFKLLDPAFTGLLAFLLGMDKLPGIWTLVGGIVTIAGVFVVQFGLTKRLEKEAAAAKLKAQLAALGEEESSNHDLHIDGEKASLPAITVETIELDTVKKAPVATSLTSNITLSPFSLRKSGSDTINNPNIANITIITTMPDTGVARPPSRRTSREVTRVSRELLRVSRDLEREARRTSMDAGINLK